jgi:dihydroneopterin triphosphate diphosphatase
MPSIRCRIIETAIFSFEDSQVLYLLLKRAPDDKLYPGTWQIVTGMIEEGETAAAAALREVAEETRILPRRFWNVPHTNTFLNIAQDTLEISAVFLVQTAPGSLPVLSNEHSDFRWCTREQARELLVWPGQIQAIDIIHHYIICGLQAAPLTEIPLHVT